MLCTAIALRRRTNDVGERRNLGYCPLGRPFTGRTVLQSRLGNGDRHEACHLGRQNLRQAAGRLSGSTKKRRNGVKWSKCALVSDK